MNGNSIEENISDLYKKIKELDPSTVQFSMRNKFFNNPTKKYFNKVKREEAFIGMILENLEKEREILNRDNITLEIEINNLQEVIKKLDVEYQNGTLLKNEIKEKMNENDENRASFYIQNVIEPLEKKLFDIKQMALIKEQSMLALEIIRRNNKEIIRNLDRIKNVTIVALNTAVVVAKSLFNQKLVLNKIQMIEKGTEGLIKGTAKVLKEDGENIYNTAINTRPEETLKTAFMEVFETLSNVDEQNKQSFPENRNQIIELKKIEGKYQK